MTDSWDYFDKFEKIDEKYLPACGEGETKATQIVTAVNKLVYKWFNDGDVFDNTHRLKGWMNDLSDYANWLDKNTDAGHILKKISKCRREADYDNLLKELADFLLVENYLDEQNKIEKVGSIYDCIGKYEFELFND